MKFLYVLIIVIAAVAIAQDPGNILIYHDSFGGAGDEVLTAIGNLWPSATVMAYTYSTGGMAAFNADLGSIGSDLDIIIIDCWCGFHSDLDWDGVKVLYDAGTVRVFASCWKWSSGAVLGDAMGVTGYIDITTTVIPHYAWEAGHDITSGITDWSWAPPTGPDVINIKMAVSDATPVTGWADTPTPGEAGICVANDGRSVISGYTPAFATEGVAIWENILEFMWLGPQALQNGTWAGIKASF
ncbi:MAG: hypothetical protein GQ565_11180 [Candidatus Aegiribacteria sp.]|nr:hypothetical protein [Candidatus Aegiribacteria sp.]